MKNLICNFLSALLMACGLVVFILFLRVLYLTCKYAISSDYISP